jgi:hypothetical protein
MTRQEALAAHHNKYFTGLPCKSGHVAERYTQSGTCEMCIKASSPYPAANPERDAERLRASEQRSRIALMRAEQSERRIALAERKVALSEKRLTLRPKPKRNEMSDLRVYIHWADVEDFKSTMLLQAQMSDPTITMAELLTNKAIIGGKNYKMYPFRCFPVDSDDLHILAKAWENKRIDSGTDEDAIAYREGERIKNEERARLRAEEDEDNGGGRPERLDA